MKTQKTHLVILSPITSLICGFALHHMIFQGIVWHCMVSHGIAFISDWSVGFGARAVSCKTPIYLI